MKEKKQIIIGTFGILLLLISLAIFSKKTREGQTGAGDGSNIRVFTLAELTPERKQAKKNQTDITSMMNAIRLALLHHGNSEATGDNGTDANLKKRILWGQPDKNHPFYRKKAFQFRDEANMTAVAFLKRVAYQFAVNDYRKNLIASQDAQKDAVRNHLMQQGATAGASAQRSRDVQGVVNALDTVGQIAEWDTYAQNNPEAFNFLVDIGSIVNNYSR